MMLFVIQFSVSLNNTQNKNFKKCSMQQKCFILKQIKFLFNFHQSVNYNLSFCLQLNFLIAEKLLMQIWVLINVNLCSVATHKCTQQCITKQNLLKAFKIISQYQNIHVFQFKCTNTYVPANHHYCQYMCTKKSTQSMVHMCQQCSTILNTYVQTSQPQSWYMCTNKSALVLVHVY